MKRKVHFTNEQINYIRKHINETETTEVYVNKKEGEPLGTSFFKAAEYARKNGLNLQNAEMVIKGSELKNVNETKKRLHDLKENTYKVIRKKDLK